jgi:hypothetical protein
MLKILLRVIEILFIFFLKSFFYPNKILIKKTIKKLPKISQQLDIIIIRFKPLI